MGKNTNKQTKKKLNRTLSKEENQMAKNHMKKFSTSLTIKEMQFKTKSRFHLPSVRMVTIKNTNNN
jgi:hypothetical protein